MRKSLLTVLLVIIFLHLSVYIYKKQYLESLNIMRSVVGLRGLESTWRKIGNFKGKDPNALKKSTDNLFSLDHKGFNSSQSDIFSNHFINYDVTPKVMLYDSTMDANDFTEDIRKSDTASIWKMPVFEGWLQSSNKSM